jgi:formylglycine-generating enzyme required for sulfatase activity
MVFVPAGPFTMGSTDAEIDAVRAGYGIDRVMYEAEVPQRTLDLPAFFLDKHEVTQADYARFVAATGREAPFVEKDWAALYNWTDGRPPEGLEQHPVVLVSFADAEAYCAWAGKALPSEAQWEKAARGSDGRAYPWGSDWAPARLNSAQTWSDAPLEGNKAWLSWWESTYKNELRGRVVTTKPAGSYPEGASPYGALDMAGNVFEWTRDWYDAYPGSTYQNPEFGQQFRVIRGGDWYLDTMYARAAARLRNPPDHKVPTIGFRCAMEAGGP